MIKGFFKWLFSSIKGFVTICAIFLVVEVIIAYFFFWGRPLKFFTEGYVSDAEAWGNFGDLIAGTFGVIFTLLSALLMVWTLREQRKLTVSISKKESSQIELQRFNNLFFELLNLYHQQTIDLNRHTQDSKFFDEYMKILHRNIRLYSRYGDAKRYAQETYLQFYTKYCYLLAPHFRTLYRIFDLIMNSEINDNRKLEYAKIVRAQLSEGELFFIRYNCMTSYGRKFIDIVNEYRLLKHLPFLSLMETKKYRNVLMPNSNENYFAINVIFYDISKEIYARVNGVSALSNKEIIIYNTGRYKLSFIMREPTWCILKLERNNIARRTNRTFRGFDMMDADQLDNLLYDFMREIFIFSNFGIFNNKETVQFIHSHKTKEDLTKIHVSVKNDIPLRLCKQGI